MFCKAEIMGIIGAKFQVHSFFSSENKGGGGGGGG